MIIAVELVWLVFLLSDIFDASIITLITGVLLTCLYTFTTFMIGVILPLLKSSGADVSFNIPQLRFWSYLNAALNVLIALFAGWYFLAVMCGLSFLIGSYLISKNTTNS